jgi:hypothetical protein
LQCGSRKGDGKILKFAAVHQTTGCEKNPLSFLISFNNNTIILNQLVQN